MVIARDVHDAGEELALATEGALPSVLNEVIGRFLSWPFKATPGWLIDRNGQRTEAFASVIHTPPVAAGSAVHDGIAADTVGAVVDAVYGIDLEGLRRSYRRIAEAKSLKKSPAPDLGELPNSTITLGVVFAVRSVVPLEDLAEELNQLNTQTPSRQWPDMVVIASTAVINYAAQFPGQPIGGDWLPPAEGAVTHRSPPPTYILLLIRPTGTYTFNKMMSFLIAHLGIFSPGAGLPNWNQILDGVPQHAMTITGYQYNLGGELLPVPRHLYNDRYLAPRPIRIEDEQGNVLSMLQFIPWQAGGVILLRGQLPLEGLLIFLGLDAEVLRRAIIMRLPDAQLSSVLPITREHFNEMLARIQGQSNMKVRADQTQFVLQRVSDEGTQSPFWSRLHLGILRLRDTAFSEASARIEFDERYEVVLSALLTTRTAAAEMVRIWEDHRRRVSSGEIARLQGGTIQIEESIDAALRREVETFLNAAVRAFKEGMQKLASHLQLDIGFLFQRQVLFERGLAGLRQTDRALADYLRETRETWSERLLDCRNAIEHDGWTLARVKYSAVGGRIKLDEPVMSGQPVTEFSGFMLDRLYSFVEELAVHCLQRLMPTGIAVTEIAPAGRAVEAPERFRLTLVNGGLPPWRLEFHRSSFEAT